MSATNHRFGQLDQLEAESIFILREAAAVFKNLVMLYSVGKDSSVLLKLAEKAFVPAKPPFPLLHIDTGYKFREMIEFRDGCATRVGVRLLVHKNISKAAQALTPDQAGSEEYIYQKKTLPLLEALKRYQFQAAIGGARREEEKSRAKERIFSIRTADGVWDPRRQRPELWNLYNLRLQSEETMRVFPLSNWTELDVWRYIQREKIEVVPLYFAEKRQVVLRKGQILRVDEFVKPRPGEEVVEMLCHYRTLGCSPSTGAIKSTATTLDEIIEEVGRAKNSERQTRAIDHNDDYAMEKKKREGYF